MSPPDVRALSNELVVLSARLIREVRRHAVDVPAASIRLLSLLDEMGPSTVGELSTADRCSQPTMTGLVNGLVDKGWVRRDPHPDEVPLSFRSLTMATMSPVAWVRTVVAERVVASGHSTDELAAAVAILAAVLQQH